MIPKKPLFSMPETTATPEQLVETLETLFVEIGQSNVSMVQLWIEICTNEAIPAPAREMLRLQGALISQLSRVTMLQLSLLAFTAQELQDMIEDKK